MRLALRAQRRARAAESRGLLPRGLRSPAPPPPARSILGATSVKQLEENLGALDVVAKLTPEVRARMEAVGGGKGQPVVNRVVKQTADVRDTAGLANFKHHGGF